ncbi:MAG: PIG-L family deacetylase [Christensenellaceae bacterium]|jgi:LmbE family N-acetylglucosaminyl deacetylase|nr:PIG-L family deacetylase [Christensenellaceae bacterium]
MLEGKCPNLKIIKGVNKICTDMVIAAHQDDVEIMCPQGIIKCRNDKNHGLVAVIVTNGSGSPRSGRFAAFTNEEMMAQRALEQERAAKYGRYTGLVSLNEKSIDVRDFDNPRITECLAEIITEYKPKTVHVHNLADKHSTHVACSLRAIDAIRLLPEELRPTQLFGCEVWRGLDWYSDTEKVVYDLTGHEKFLQSLLNIFESQIAGGKRYDLAAKGRWVANAVYAYPRSVDEYKVASYAMDLSVLIKNSDIKPKEFILSKIEDFKNSILI